MAKRNVQPKAIIKRDPALLDIFSEEQIHCKDLSKLDTPIGRCFDLLRTDLNQNALSPVKEATPHVMSIIDQFLKNGGVPSKEILAADMDKISNEIQHKMAQGIYELA